MGCNQYNIRDYIQRYWKGETTLAEEREIKQYFTFNKIPVDLKDEAVYFLNITSYNQENTLGADFDNTMLNLMDESLPTKGKIRWLNSSIFRIAAAAIVIVSIGWFTWNATQSPTLAESNQPDSTTFEINDFISIEDQLESNESYRKTKNTFMLIGNKMNKVVKHAEKLNKINHLNSKKKK